MPSSLLRTRLRRTAVTSAFFPALVLGGLAIAPSAAAADVTPPVVLTADDAAKVAPATTGQQEAAEETDAARATRAPQTVPAATVPSAGPAAATTLERSATVTPAPKPAATMPVKTPAGEPTSKPSGAVPEKVFGMKAPKNPEDATNDDEILAWTIKNASVAERHQIAEEMGIRYPAAVEILGSVCDKGQGYIGVWAINLAATEARWNVTLDGRGYAGARVLPQSHDYGAIGVPNGRHAVAFVNPATGAVGARTSTSLRCGVVAPKPATKPVSKPMTPKAPVATPRAVAPRPASPVVARPAAVPAAAPQAQAPAAVGPTVQTDYEAPAHTAASSRVRPTGLAVAGVLAAGAVLLRRRFMH